MTKLLILGVGSPFGDDRFGWEAAEALRHSAVMSAVGKLQSQGRIAKPTSMTSGPAAPTPSSRP